MAHWNGLFNINWAWEYMRSVLHDKAPQRVQGIERIINSKWRQ